MSAHLINLGADLNISNELNRLGKVVFCLFSVAGLLTSINSFADRYPDAEMVASLEQTVRQVSLQLPIVTQGSILVAVRAGPGKRVTYSSVVPTPSREWTKSMIDMAKRMQINGFCTKPNFSFWREENVSVTYETSDESNIFVYSNTVSIKDCH